LKTSIGKLVIQNKQTNYYITYLFILIGGGWAKVSLRHWLQYDFELSFATYIQKPVASSRSAHTIKKKYIQFVINIFMKCVYKNGGF